MALFVARLVRLLVIGLIVAFGLLLSCGRESFESRGVGVGDLDVAPATAQVGADDLASDIGGGLSIPTAVPTAVAGVDGSIEAGEAAAATSLPVDETCDTRFFPGYAPDEAWCSDDWALATIDGFGVELASYRLVEGASREIATGPITGQIDIAEVLNLGIPLRTAEELCRRSANSRTADPGNCAPHSSAAASSLAFVQAHLWRVTDSTPANDAANRDIAAVRTGLEYSPFLNRLASWEAAGASTGCWVRTGTITAQCAIDIRDFNGSIVDTVVVSSYPQGVVDETFDGFTGRYEATGVATSLAAAGIDVDRWVLSASAFGPVTVGATLREAQRQLGFGLDLAGGTGTGAGSCFFATPDGFVGLFYIVSAAAGNDPFDGVIQAIVISAPDYPAASGIRVGSPSDALVVTLGDQLIPRDHASSAEGRYFDMPETPAAERLVRFEAYDGEVISQMRSGLASAVTATDGCG